MRQTVLPEPSRLFSLQPEGIVTGATESLASYAMRLAEAHCLDVSSLIHRFIQPLIGSEWKDTPARKGFGKMDKVYKHTVTPAHVHMGKWIDMGEETRATVAALSKLTKRENLRLLTLIPLSGYVSSDTILRYQRAWCPCCYEDQKCTGKPIHDLLLWSFRDVCVCPYHEQRLRSACNWCGAKQPILKYWSQPGYCMKCGLWLGREDNRHGRIDGQDLWKANAVAKVIGSWAGLPSRETKTARSIQSLLSKSYVNNTFRARGIIKGLLP
ncbi:MAG: TniQ family protein [Elainellaceae cyanobacterium]